MLENHLVVSEVQNYVFSTAFATFGALFFLTKLSLSKYVTN